MESFPVGSISVLNFVRVRFLFISDKPVIDASPDGRKSASELGGEGVLECRARGAPNITFQWFREGRHIADGEREGEGAKYGIIDSSLDPLTWQSQLKVTEVEMKDYGPYSCQVS